MANLEVMNLKRKDLEVANDGASIFLQPKRIKSQDDEIPEMMEEEKPPTHAAPAGIVPNMTSWLPTDGQKASHNMEHTACGGRTSEQQVRVGDGAAAPMDVELDGGQCRPQMQLSQIAPFWSGFF